MVAGCFTACGGRRVARRRARSRARVDGRGARPAVSRASSSGSSGCRDRRAAPKAPAGLAAALPASAASAGFGDARGVVSDAFPGVSTDEGRRTTPGPRNHPVL
mmetsp:Transcript_3304/g.11406  ORF Transcript_3304/g.11406 Transcript_3304/m.11406 type:complete len:104 (+) Transcript_3304:691-1002(+)